MLSEFWLRLRAFIFRRKFDRDLEDEIAFHLAMQQSKHNSAGPAGANKLAREAALQQFGNPTLARENLREMLVRVARNAMAGHSVWCPAAA